MLATNNVEYRALLPQEYLNELREMADRKVIPSIEQGIIAIYEISSVIRFL